MTNTNKPAHKMKIGRVSVAIWQRVDSLGRVRYSVSLYRTYKEGDTYKDTHTLDADDILHAMKLLDDAQNWIRAQTK